MKRFESSALVTIASGCVLLSLGGCATTQRGVVVRPVPSPASEQVDFTASRQGNDWRFDLSADTVYVYPGDEVEWRITTAIPGLVEWEIDLQDPKLGSPARIRHVRPATAPGNSASAQIRLDAEPGHYKYSITIRVPNPSPGAGAAGRPLNQLLVTLDPIIRVRPD